MEIQREERSVPTGDPESLQEGDGAWKDHPSRHRRPKFHSPPTTVGQGRSRKPSLCFKMDPFF